VTAARRTVAAFDFDGTLTRRDSLVPFLARAVGWSKVSRMLVSHAAMFTAVALGRHDRDMAKERVLVRTLAGVPVDTVNEAGRVYGAHLVAHKLRRSMLERVAWHRREGHDVVIVSASLRPYLDEVARRLGVDALLCTELEVDDGGRCTGRMTGGNCRGLEKATRLRAYLGDGEVSLWAYGDSPGDREMLAMADYPTLLSRRDSRFVGSGPRRPTHPRG
jgi:HAD superfamily hydrolase (TIGR01490 family)